MKVELTREKNVLVVAGSLDRFNLSDPGLYNYLDFEQEVVIDLSKANNTDTAGLAFLLKLVNFYEQKSKSVSISGQSEQLIALAQISNVLELLPFQNKD